jgi:hypothetical protein
VSTYDPLGIDYMCPFCVTPWKCNGPHIEPHDEPEFQTYIDNHWDEAIGQAIKAIYADCRHTKYEGCRPCPHDEIAHRVGELETPQRKAIRALTREAQELDLYGATDGPPPETR